jgi:hypothetical protein
MKLGDLRATLYTLLYCLLLVVVCGVMIESGVSHIIVVPIGMFVLPLIAAAPFFFVLTPPKE